MPSYVLPSCGEFPSSAFAFLGCSGKRTELHLNRMGWTDTVVWNPHETLNIGDAWKKFVCVESAAVSEKIVLDSGKVWTAETNMFVADVD